MKENTTQKIYWFLPSLFAAMIGFVFLLTTAMAAESATLLVDNTNTACNDTSGAPYCTIQAAINAANNGDTIDVAKGTYTENVNISKNLTLTANGAVVDGAGSNTITTNGNDISVTISGFHLTNGANGLFTMGNHTLLFTNSTVSNNSNSGVYIGGSNATLHNLTISGNGSTSGFMTAGLYNDSGSISLNNVTLTNNYDTAIINFGFGGTTAVLTTTNSIIDGSCNNSSGTFTSLGYNLSSGASCPLVVGGDQMLTNPLLSPLQDNGGPTPTHALLSASPAINAGNPATPGNGAAACLATDQRGRNRPQSAACDIGAFESGAELSIYKSGPTITTAGDLITYTLTIANDGIVAATNLVMTDTLPTGANHVQGGTFMAAANAVRWEIPTLAPTESITRQFAVTATNTITNELYWVTAENAFDTTGNTPVTTQIGFFNYLPVIMSEPSQQVPITLISPINGSQLNTLIPTFVYETGDIPANTGGCLAFSTDPNPEFCRSSFSLFSNQRTEHTAWFNLQPNTIYYWRVGIVYNYDYSNIEWSEQESFTTGPNGGIILPGPNLIAPSNNSAVSSDEIILQWAAVSGTVEYDVFVRDKDEGMLYGISTTDTQVGPGSLAWIFNSTNSTHFEWYVIARNDYAWGDASATWNFNLSAPNSQQELVTQPNLVEVHRDTGVTATYYNAK